MAAKGRPYELFGSYLLFKKLENDRLSELWRAGEIVDGQVRNTVILRRFTGGDRDGFRQAAEHARSVVAGVTGTTIVKNQKIGFVNGVPYLAHEYTGGRSLRTIADKARGVAGAGVNPIPVDQAISIVEKLALSAETLSNMRYQGARLTHTALLPQFVWIGEEGEVRSAGQQLGKGISASLAQPEVAKEFAGYFAPEVRNGGEFGKASDVYALGAILYLLLTGIEPPASGIEQTISTVKLHAKDEPIAADIRVILERALNPDPAKRYDSAGDMRQALDKLLNGGEYSPTTFNLAFYLHNLLKKELEVEIHERNQEAKVDVAAYQSPAADASQAPTVMMPAPAVAFGSSILDQHQQRQKNRKPLLAAAAVIVVLAGGAGAFVVISKNKPAVPAAVTTAAAMQLTPAPAQTPKIEPIVAAVPETAAIPAATATTATAAPGIDAEAARKKAIEDAIQKRLQEEMMKLQEQYNKELQKKKVMEPASTPAVVAAITKPAVTRPAAVQEPEQTNTISAAQLDQQRRAQTQAQVEAVQTTSAPQQQLPAAPPEPAQAQVREGDLVAVNELDTVPELRNPVRPTYPPMALKKRSEGTVIVSALISETGKVLDVRILRGDPSKSGFDEAATKAVRGATFTSPMKDGKRVRTWKPLPIIFKLQ